MLTVTGGAVLEGESQVGLVDVFDGNGNLREGGNLREAATAPVPQEPAPVGPLWDPSGAGAVGPGPVAGGSAAAPQGRPSLSPSTAGAAAGSRPRSGIRWPACPPPRGKSRSVGRTATDKISVVSSCKTHLTCTSKCPKGPRNFTSSANPEQPPPLSPCQRSPPQPHTTWPERGRPEYHFPGRWWGLPRASPSPPASTRAGHSL